MQSTTSPTAHVPRRANLHDDAVAYRQPGKVCCNNERSALFTVPGFNRPGVKSKVSEQLSSRRLCAVTSSSMCKLLSRFCIASAWALIGLCFRSWTKVLIKSPHSSKIASRFVRMVFNLPHGACLLLLDCVCVLALAYVCLLLLDCFCVLALRLLAFACFRLLELA